MVLAKLLRKEVMHSDKLIINTNNKKELEVQELELYQPKTQEELIYLLDECQNKKTSFKLIKGEQIISCNNSFYNNKLVIDLALLDQVMSTKNSTIIHELGLTTRQLSQLLQKSNSNIFLPLAKVLKNDFLLPMHHLQNNIVSAIDFTDLNLTDNKEIIIIGINSIKTVYNMFNTIDSLKSELSSFIDSMVLLNQTFAIRNNYLIEKHLKSTKQFNELKKHIVKYKWIFLIE